MRGCGAALRPVRLLFGLVCAPVGAASSCGLRWVPAASAGRKSSKQKEGRSPVRYYSHSGVPGWRSLRGIRVLSRPGGPPRWSSRRSWRPGRPKIVEKISTGNDIKNAVKQFPAALTPQALVRDNQILPQTPLRWEGLSVSVFLARTARNHFS